MIPVPSLPAKVLAPWGPTCRVLHGALHIDRMEAESCRQEAGQLQRLRIAPSLLFASVLEAEVPGYCCVQLPLRAATHYCQGGSRTCHTANEVSTSNTDAHHARRLRSSPMIRMSALCSGSDRVRRYDRTFRAS